MKIKYQFATETVEIEVADDWGNLVIDLDRQEYNNDHAETRRHYSLDAITYEGEEYGSEDDAVCNFAEYEDLRNAIAQLTPNQQAIIKAHFFEGLTFTEIAKRMGTSHQAIQQAVERAKKQILKKLL